MSISRDDKHMGYDVPPPTHMPVDREQWAQELHLSNFVNSYYQYRDLQRLKDCRKLLIVGPGQGLDTCVLKWRGYEVQTFDIDETFKPDHIGSVHDLSRFTDAAFDAVIASHVLEHLALPYLDRCLSELARVARYSLMYLPVHGRHVQLRMIPGFGGFDFSFIADIFNWLEKPDGLTQRYTSGQHYWEVGMRGFRVPDLIRRFSSHFEVLDTYRNRDWLPSQNFILKSRQSDVR
jgi:Methyltransferase domain